MRPESGNWIICEVDIASLKTTDIIATIEDSALIFHEYYRLPESSPGVRTYFASDFVFRHEQRPIFLFNAIMVSTGADWTTITDQRTRSVLFDVSSASLCGLVPGFRTISCHFEPDCGTLEEEEY